MKRSQLILLATIAGSLLSGCVDGRFVKKNTPNDCGSTGWTLTAVHYGDSRIVIIPISEIVADTEFRFALVPQKETSDAIDYKDAKVKIKGVASKFGAVAGADSTWLDTEGKYNGNDKKIGSVPYISECIPDTLSVDDTIYYEVSVEQVGTIDPRAKVIRGVGTR